MTKIFDATQSMLNQSTPEEKEEFWRKAQEELAKREQAQGGIRLVTTDEGAAIAGVTRQTIKRWIREGVIQSYGHSRKYLVNANELTKKSAPRNATPRQIRAMQDRRARSNGAIAARPADEAKEA